MQSTRSPYSNCDALKSTSDGGWYSTLGNLAVASTIRLITVWLNRRRAFSLARAQALPQ